MQTIWELDFYSCPILDENNKKLWEVLICETPLKIDQSTEKIFKYSQFCPNTTVNSIFLRETIEKAIQESGQTPQKIRFFRRQMNNMITKACEDAGIPAAPSRRTHALNQWLEERMQNFYPQQPGYDEKAAKSASVQYPELNAISLPDAVRGDKGDQWAFVTLEASAFGDMEEWDIGFGEAFPLAMMALTPKTKIPGLIIYSKRALPLAGWLSGLEMGYLHLEENPLARVILETGASDSWYLANMTNKETIAEAKNFEQAKNQAHGVHFLAIQTSPDSESFAGFWLLKE
jgi:RNA-binding protein Tab2/Atab2